MSSDARKPTRVSLQHHGITIGDLVLVPANADVGADAMTLQVVAQVAPHVALVADACRVDVELQRSREQLVQAREEERRRLRRDLHDGLGPLLAGAAFSADAASNLVRVEPDRAHELLGARPGRSESARLDEIRRIVEDLRPPAIDELGLAGALRHHVARFPNLQVTVTAPEPAPELSAAVEVAAYRIVTEAITNVARHSDAQLVNVDIQVNGSLELAVHDDGSSREVWRRASACDRCTIVPASWAATSRPVQGRTADMFWLFFRWTECDRRDHVLVADDHDVVSGILLVAGNDR